MSERAAKDARRAARQTVGQYSVEILADHEQQLRMHTHSINTLIYENEQLRRDLGALQREQPKPDLWARLRWLCGR